MGCSIAFPHVARRPFMLYLLDGVVLQVSEELPLMEAASDESAMPPFAFASGLTVQDRTVVIAYGAGDRDARGLVMTMDRLDEFFACNSTTTTLTTTSPAARESTDSSR